MDPLIAHLMELLAVAVLVAILARRLHLPYTVGLVVAGAALAIFRVDLGIGLTREVIFGVILPPLLFEAAINIPWDELKRDLTPILTLSILGVMVSAAVVAAGMALILGWPWAPAIVFAVLIAATDPVAVIAMFKDTGVGGRLRLLVESESLFNDGVAAVLFGLALSFTLGEAGSEPGVLTLIRVAGGGVLMGLAAGLLALLVAGRTPEPVVEALVSAVAAYGAFLAADHFGASGVLATVCAGLVFGNMGTRKEGAWLGLSAHGRSFLIEVWDFAAFIANSAVFLLIGVAVAKVPFKALGLGPLVVAILLVLAGRAATVYPISFLFARTHWKVLMAHQHVLWWGGLRGALALALSLSLPSRLALRDEVVIATFGVVVFSVLLQGLSMPLLMRRLGILRSRG
jgi:CPA1 family monovalent cation:H+ antiporter